MNFIHILTNISLVLPLFIFFLLGKTAVGEDFPIFFGLTLQAVAGSVILLYARGYEHKNQIKIYIGYLIFFLGLSGSYLSGKTFLLLFFWEISTVGAIFIYLGGEFSEKAIKSIVNLFLASSISMILLCVWIFLPDNDRTGFYFLLAALMLKSAFSGLHFWLPPAHSGPPAHGSAAYSGLMINLPILLFSKYSAGIQDLKNVEILILFSGLGVFMGGVTSFFNTDIKKSLAYSTIENSNFLWLCVLAAEIWGQEQNPELKGLGSSFLFLFFTAMAHHSLSKTFQFLSFGYIAKKAGSTIIDECRGFGRKLELSFLSKSAGTFSFLGIPGSPGFIAECSFLYLASVIISLPVSKSEIILPSLVFITIGLAAGSAAHMKLYLSMNLSVSPRKEETVSHSETVNISLNILGYMIILFTPVLGAMLLFYEPVRAAVPVYFSEWMLDICSAGIAVIIFSAVYAVSAKRNKVESRVLWDCGNGYRGTEISIPASVISDPLFRSMGTYLHTDDGESRIDRGFFSLIKSVLNLGRFWNRLLESGDLANYLFFSAAALLVSVAVLLVYQTVSGFRL